MLHRLQWGRNEFDDFLEKDSLKKGRNKQFDNTFIELARSVYFTNDERAKIKLEINKKFGSLIVEVKSYEKY